MLVGIKNQNMKCHLLIVILSITSLFAYGQIPNGTYKSSNESFRANYFLIVNEGQVTLFGWERIENDIIYYRSTARFDSNNHLTFDKFEFQKEKVTERNLNVFKPDDTLKIAPFLLHRYLMNLKELNGQISLIATKDTYYSRTDTFYFDKT
jgi:hypothetical protein